MSDGPRIRPVDGDFGPVPPQKEPKPKRGGGGGKSGSARSIQNDIAALLIQANLMLAPVLKEDVMDDVEILALAKAIDDQAKKSPRFRAAVQRMFTMMGGTNIAGVVIIIAARRAARHGMISPEWDQNLAGYLALSQMTPSQMMSQMEDAMEQMMAAQAAQEMTNGATDATPTQPGPVPAEAPRTS